MQKTPTRPGMLEAFESWVAIRFDRSLRTINSNIKDQIRSYRDIIELSANSAETCYFMAAAAVKVCDELVDPGHTPSSWEADAAVTNFVEFTVRMSIAVDAAVSAARSVRQGLTKTKDWLLQQQQDTDQFLTPHSRDHAIEKMDQAINRSILLQDELHRIAGHWLKAELLMKAVLQNLEMLQVTPGTSRMEFSQLHKNCGTIREDFCKYRTEMEYLKADSKNLR